MPISTKGTPAIAAAKSARLGPVGPSTVRSTSPAIHLKNFYGLGKLLEARLSSGKDDGIGAKLAGWHIDAMALDGDLKHIGKAEALLRTVLSKTKDPNKRHPIQRQLAGVLAERHAFADAKALLTTVLSEDPKDAAAAASLAKVRRNLGEVKPGTRPASKPNGFAGWSDMAIAEYLAGNIEAADLALRRAHAAYPDVHPVPLAWIDLQRGLLRLRTGRYAEARDFFAAAHKRLPQYWVVAEHLAETEALLGNHARALTLYDGVVESTGLPEFMAARAGVLAAMGRHAEAKEQLAVADKRWRALLADHGVTVAVHAIEFFLSDRLDAAFAQTWADKNLEVRRDAGSVLLAARAHAANGDKEGARALIREASKMPPRTDEFFADLSDAYVRIGDLTSAKIAHAQAVSLNPKTPPLAATP